MLRMYIGLQTWVASMRDREEGQALVEYALILALIAVVSIVALTDLGTAVSNQLTAIGTAIAVVVWPMTANRSRTSSRWSTSRTWARMT